MFTVELSRKIKCMLLKNTFLLWTFGRTDKNINRIKEDGFKEREVQVTMYLFLCQHLFVKVLYHRGKI